MTQTRATVEQGYRPRALFFGFLLLLCLAGLAVRYFHLMVSRHDELLRAQYRQVVRTEIIPGRRGSLLDRRGRALALTRTNPSVAVDPGLVAPEDRDHLAGLLAAVLHLEPRAVRARLEEDTRFRWLARQIKDPVIATRVKAILDPAVIVVDEATRSWPAGRAAAHLVGFTERGGGGIAGVELQYDRYLAAKPGSRRVLRDGLGRRRVVTLASEPARDGEDVVLALDLVIQSFVEEALDQVTLEWRPQIAIAVVMDPRNGEVLAMGSRPDFDPEDRNGHPITAFRIPAATDVFELGSVMKPLVAAAALDHGVVSASDSFDCTTTGVFRFPGRTLRDYKPMGVLSFEDVLVRSSNIGMGQMGLALGIERLRGLVRRLGFEKPPGSGLPGEGGGLVPRSQKWSLANAVLSVPMGHEIAVTPLQFTAAFASLLNGGNYFPPRIALRIGDRAVPMEPGRQIYRPEVTNRFILPTLVKVVEDEKGTGRNARVPGYHIGGKTGTAEILLKGKTKRVDGYVTSFVGFGPAEEPRFLVLLVLRKPTPKGGVSPSGSSTAAPAVGRILEQCLKYAGIDPELPPDPEPTTARPPPGPVERPLRLREDHRVLVDPAPAPVLDRKSRNRELDRRQLELRRGR